MTPKPRILDLSASLCILAIIACVLPIVSVYSACFLMAGYIWYSRQAFASASEKKLHGSLLIYLLLTTLAQIISTSLAEESMWVTMKPWTHFISKHVIFWFVPFGFFACARDIHRSQKFNSIGHVTAILCTVHLVYCLAQRFAGIDWVHGLGAHLGTHRMAGNAFRVSGFMGHPLTLAYNLLATSAVFFCWSINNRQSGINLKSPWYWAGAANFAALMVSGSRFPIILAITLLGLLHVIYLRGRRLYLLAVACCMAIGLLWEGSFIRRMGELASLPSLYDTRLYHWHTYWKIALDHSIAGVGLGNIAPVISAYYRQLGYDDSIKLAHNMLLQVFADSGLLGLLGYGVWWLTLLRQRQTRACSWLLAVVFLSGLTQSNLRDSENLYCFLFLFWMTKSELEDDTGNATNPKNYKS